MQKVSWKKEITRDFLTFGSWIFYLLILSRAMIGPYRPFVDQMIFAGLFLFIVSFFIKNSDYSISRGLVISVFTILFYNNFQFSIFVSLIFLVMIYSSYLIHLDKKSIFYGLIIGSIGCSIGYFLPSIF